MTEEEKKKTKKKKRERILSKIPPVRDLVLALGFVVSVVAIACAVTALVISNGNSTSGTTNSNIAASSLSANRKYQIIPSKRGGTRFIKMDELLDGATDHGGGEYSILKQDSRGNEIIARISVADIDSYKKDARAAAMPAGASCVPSFTPGVRWRRDVSYMIDTTGLSGSFKSLVTSSVPASFASWFALTSENIDAYNIPWNGILPNLMNPIGNNVIYFARISDPSILALTMTFAIASEPDTSDNEIVEFAMIFNNIDHPMGDASIDSSVYHFPRIMGHEDGHALAQLGDVYAASCASATLMYGYSSVGQTSPSIPQQPDQQAFNALYLPVQGKPEAIPLVYNPSGDSSVLSSCLWLFILLLWTMFFV